MAFEGLTDKLSAAFKRLRSKGKLSEADVKEAMREVRLALLEADVNYKVAKDFTKTVTERAVGAQVMESLTPAQMVIKIVNEELTALMGGEAVRLATTNRPPCIIMMCGLQGSGKTTHSGKLGLMLKKQGHRPLLAACDVYRPAAITQLQVVGGKAGVPVFEMGTADPVDIAKKAVAHARDHGNDYVILDTAGRLHIDETLMNELKNVKAAVSPHEILLVVDAMTGQDAVNVAASFNEALGIDGVVLTKLDGDTRGGAALSVRAVTGKPIKFAGVGEKLDELEVFHPERMASRILGDGGRDVPHRKGGAAARSEGGRKARKKNAGGSVRSQRHAGSAPSDTKDGQPEKYAGHDPRPRQPAQGHRDRRAPVLPRGSHHPLHDPRGAHQARHPQPFPQAADRRGLRHEGRGRQPPRQAV